MMVLNMNDMKLGPCIWRLFVLLHYKKRAGSLLLKLSVPVCLQAAVVMEKAQKCLAREDVSVA